MRIAPRFVVLAASTAALAGCASGGILDRQRPDEFAVQRQAPLVVPPEFELVPPTPGSPRPTEGTAAQQAMDTLFGGPAPRSVSESATLQNAGEADVGIRSSAGDTGTFTVDKGDATRTIIAAPEGDGQDARAAIPE